METRRKIKVWSIATMDGYVSRLNGEMDFMTDNPGLSKEDYGFRAFYNSIAYAVMNRTQYINSGGLWSAAGKPCYVVTDSDFLHHPSQNIRLMLTGNGGVQSILTQIRELQNEEGEGDIWLIGDRELISLLVAQRMVDEITVTILPVMLGSGIPLFSPGDKVNYWKLLDHQKFDNGVLQMTYRIKRNE